MTSFEPMNMDKETSVDPYAFDAPVNVNFEEETSFVGAGEDADRASNVDVYFQPRALTATNQAGRDSIYKLGESNLAGKENEETPTGTPAVGAKTFSVFSSATPPTRSTPGKVSSGLRTVDLFRKAASPAPSPRKEFASDSLVRASPAPSPRKELASDSIARASPAVSSARKSFIPPMTPEDEAQASFSPRNVRYPSTTPGATQPVVALPQPSFVETPIPAEETSEFDEDIEQARPATKDRARSKSTHGGGANPRRSSMDAFGISEMRRVTMDGNFRRMSMFSTSALLPDMDDSPNEPERPVPESEETSAGMITHETEAYLEQLRLDSNSSHETVDDERDAVQETESEQPKYYVDKEEEVEAPVQPRQTEASTVYEGGEESLESYQYSDRPFKEDTYVEPTQTAVYEDVEPSREMYSERASEADESRSMTTSRYDEEQRESAEYEGYREASRETYKIEVEEEQEVVVDRREESSMRETASEEPVYQTTEPTVFRQEETSRSRYELDEVEEERDSGFRQQELAPEAPQPYQESSEYADEPQYEGESASAYIRELPSLASSRSEPSLQEDLKDEAEEEDVSEHYASSSPLATKGTIASPEATTENDRFAHLAPSPEDYSALELRVSAPAAPEASKPPSPKLNVRRMSAVTQLLSEPEVAPTPHLAAPPAKSFPSLRRMSQLPSQLRAEEWEEEAEPPVAKAAARRMSFAPAASAPTPARAQPVAAPQPSTTNQHRPMILAPTRAAAPSRTRPAPVTITAPTLPRLAAPTVRTAAPAAQRPSYAPARGAPVRAASPRPSAPTRIPDSPTNPGPRAHSASASRGLLPGYMTPTQSSRARSRMKTRPAVPASPTGSLRPSSPRLVGGGKVIGMTEPKTPHLSTMGRARSSSVDARLTATSRELERIAAERHALLEQRERERAQVQRIATTSHPIPAQHALTEFQPFHLRTSELLGEVARPQQEFKSTAEIAEKILTRGVKLAPHAPANVRPMHTMPDYVPRSPQLATSQLKTRTTTTKSSEEMELERIAAERAAIAQARAQHHQHHHHHGAVDRHSQAVMARSRTEPQPFALESLERHDRAQRELEARIERERQEEELLRSSFRARPVPASVTRGTPMRRSMLPEEIEQQQAPMTGFKARPVPRTTYVPASLPEVAAAGPAMEPESFELETEARALQRMRAEAQRREHEEALQVQLNIQREVERLAEEAAMREYRASLVHKPLRVPESSRRRHSMMAATPSAVREWVPADALPETDPSSFALPTRAPPPGSAVRRNLSLGGGALRISSASLLGEVSMTE